MLTGTRETDGHACNSTVEQTSKPLPGWTRPTFRVIALRDSEVNHGVANNDGSFTTS